MMFAFTIVLVCVVFYRDYACIALCALSRGRSMLSTKRDVNSNVCAFVQMIKRRARKHFPNKSPMHVAVHEIV